MWLALRAEPAKAKGLLTMWFVYNLSMYNLHELDR